MSPPPLLKSDVCTLSCFSRVQLCDPVDHSRPGSSVHRDSPGKNTGWFAISSTRGSSQPGEWSCISCLLRWQAGSSPPAPSGKPFKSDTLTVTPVTGMIWQVSFFCFDINVLWQVIQIGHLSSPDFFHLWYIFIPNFSMFTGMNIELRMFKIIQDLIFKICTGFFKSDL